MPAPTNGHPRKRALTLLIFFVALFIFFVFMNRGPENVMVNFEHEEAAKQTLIAFFESLEEKNYEEALNYFYPEIASISSPGTGGSRTRYDWNLIAKYTATDGSKADQLGEYCDKTKSCLPANVISTQSGSDNLFSFNVQFTRADGSLLSYQSDKIYDSRRKDDTTFIFQVKRMGIPDSNAIYVVTTPPINTLE